ncbi:MAG: hypothetical protein KDA42_10755, partial [Planctomycetales bacterium]|nr:hypothetical protein [Planctomycetales bacterium]
RFVLIEPLARSRYKMETRAQDLVDQMMVAKIKNADGIFVPDPFDTENGLMNSDGTPGELLLPWRTTALMLGGSKFIGSIRLPQGSRNYIFSRGNEAVMVVWNEGPMTEEIYLGEDVHQIDIWGRKVRAEMTKDGLRQRIRVDSISTFVTGVSEQISRWRMACRFEHEKLPSVFGSAHRNGLKMTNFFQQGAGGEVTLVTPKVWKVYPQTMTFKMAVGEELNKHFGVEFPFTASSGTHEVRIDFDVNVDRRYRFSVWRDLDIGLGDVKIDLSTKLDPKGNLIVEQRMTNVTDKQLEFRCYLYAPDRRRQRNQVYALGREPDLKRYVLPKGEELLGETLWLRAEEVGGARTLNYRFEAVK